MFLIDINCRLQHYTKNLQQDAKNRPLLIAYNKHQFEKEFGRRRSPQKAPLIRHHQTVYGNFTWAAGLNCSLHTAIGNTSARTAIEMDEQGNGPAHNPIHQSCRF